MTKKQKKTKAVKVAKKTYSARWPDVDGKPRCADVIVVDGIVTCVAEVEGTAPQTGIGLDLETWLDWNGGADVDLELIDEVQVEKNASESVAAETEAGPNPDQEAQTDENIAKKSNIRKPVLRTLRFPLTPPEIDVRCQNVAKKSRAVDELEGELARVKADYKGRIEKLQNEIRHDLRCVEDREESREVLADEVHDFDAAMVRWEYNGATYEQREMTPRERQMTIEGVL